MTTNVIEINNDYEYLECEITKENIVVEYVTNLLSYDEYFSKYLRNNIPCVMKFATDLWPCRHEWVAEDAPNFEYLKKAFGSSVAPVADCTTKYYNSQMKDNMTMNEYIDYWIAYRESKNSEKKNLLLYLKDWHCVKNNPDIPIYEVPSYFASDWLNEYYMEKEEELNDDYMFVYMGPKGSWTPFHADVFSSYSWSANIVGKKRWLLFEPGKEDMLKDKHGQLIYDIESEELRDPNVYPKYNEETLKRYEIIQEPGEIVFVPSGWHHQVWNLEDTISINHNWINGCNVWNVWISLKKELFAVMKEVYDCRDMDNWDDHCQLMLKASHGMNYRQFYNFLLFLARKRIAFIKEDTPVISFGKWKLGRNHCLYDLKQIKIVLEDMIGDTKEKFIQSIVFSGNDARLLVLEINEILLINR